MSVIKAMLYYVFCVAEMLISWRQQIHQPGKATANLIFSLTM